MQYYIKAGACDISAKITTLEFLMNTKTYFTILQYKI